MNETREKIEETNPIASETAEKDLQKRKWLKNIIGGFQLIGMICLSLAILALLGSVWYWCAFEHHNSDAPKAGKSMAMSDSMTMVTADILGATYREDPYLSIKSPSEIISFQGVHLSEIYAPIWKHPSDTQLYADTEYLFSLKLPDTYRAELENERDSFGLEINYTFQAKAREMVIFEVKLYNRETGRLYYGCFEAEAGNDLCLKHEMSRNSSVLTLRLDADYLSFSFYTSALSEDGPKVTKSSSSGSISVSRSISGVDQVVPTYPEYMQAISGITVSDKIFYEVPPTPKPTQESIPESTPETTPLPKTPPLPAASSESESGTEQ